MNEEKDIKGTKGSTTNKIKKLHKQYNKILVDLFDQFAAESIEEALEDNEGSFGENIQEIVSKALENLKGKVMAELGVKGAGDGSVGEIGITVGGIDLANGMDMNNSPLMDDEDNEEHEESETPEEEAEEHAEGESEEDEDDDKKPVKESYVTMYLQEKAPPGAKAERMVKHIKASERKAGKSPEEAKKIAFATAWKKHNESNGTLNNDKLLSESRRSDQTSIMEAYLSIHKS